MQLIGNQNSFCQPKIFVYGRTKYSLFAQYMNSISNKIGVYGTDIYVH